MASHEQTMLAAFIAYNHERLLMRALQHFLVKHRPGCEKKMRDEDADCTCGRNVVLEAMQAEVDKEPEVAANFTPEQAVNVFVLREMARKKKAP